MKNFRKAVRDSLHHWPRILISTLCAMGVAALWSANIGALWPVIDMTLRGESMQTHYSKLVDEQSKELDSLTAQVATAPPDRQEELQRQIANVQDSQVWNRRWLSMSQRFLPQDPFHTICFIMAGVLLSTLIKHILMMANDLLVASVSTSIVKNLRTRLFERTVYMDRRTYDQHGTSMVMALITNTCDGLAGGLMNLFGSAIREPMRIISCLALAAYFNWRLLIASLVLAPTMIFFVVYCNRKIKTVAHTIIGKTAFLHEVLLEALNNIRTVQAYTTEPQECQRFDDSAETMRRISLKLTFYSGLSRPFTELIGISMVTVTVCLGSYLIVNQATHIGFVRLATEPMQISTLLIFFGLLIGASDPLRKLNGVFTSIYTGGIAADAIYGVIESPTKLTEPASPRRPQSPHRVLSIRGVDFAYEPSHPVLQDISLDIPYGRTVAILGGNGSGKSTLINLLCRYYDPSAGTLSLDDVRYDEMTLREVRRRIALVSQTTEMFNRTVMENIRYGREDASEQEVIEAAKLAHAHEFILTSLTHGYDTIVGSAGSRLSGGQRQRIALARAILRKPEILILDESTSQIDMGSELLIRDSIATLAGHMTIIIITHREALISLADEVYTVENHRLVRQSEHSHEARAA